MSATKTHNWSRFAKRILIKKPIKTVFSAWTTASNLEKWFLSDAKYTMPNGKTRPSRKHIGPGDTYEWQWFCYDVVETGKVLKVEAPNMVQFSFGKVGIVTINLSRLKGRTLVELVQEKIPTDENSKLSAYVGCNLGWNFYLANLKAFLETGSDLREKEVLLEDMVNS